MALPTSAQIMAAIGLSCHNCNKVQELEVTGAGGPLLRCGGCHRVSYCSADWRHHKALCTVLQSVAQNIPAMENMAKIFPRSSQNDLKTLDDISEANTSRMGDLCEEALGRSLKDRERGILVYEPKCLACARTSIVLGAEARVPQSQPTNTELIPCPRCKTSFFCSEEHWSIVRPQHEAPCDDLPGGLSQCDMNRQNRVDAEFRTMVTAEQEKRFMWSAITRQSTWSSLKGTTWDGVLASDVRNAVAGTVFESRSASCVRRVSSLASISMTILYALEHLNVNTAWTMKDKLFIHMIGSPADFHPAVAYFEMYEAILHRLPKLRTLCLSGLYPSPALHLCFGRRSCAATAHPQRGFVITLSHGRPAFNRTYEGFFYNEAELFMPPDLCVASNSSIHAHTDPEQWRRTIKLLIDRGIPTVFTDYTRCSAEINHAILRECGAELVPSLTLVKNPFGDPMMNPNSERVHGFHGSNAWFAGAFR
ncbi:hypothetical protein B0H17DRAFT_1149749 [Mycena rosella]|uniref:Mitochondrial splicing suppressor 51-like C-terminal domain-containing protein n=1 Tax=Mycena rosella TaxID=1033263 RepID=A0AAD7BYK4_MYCRO|nr:hypothetical protein B0H17DRAFT_1149749 [Mycena rosella]